MPTDAVDKIWHDWREAVNMTSSEIEDFLATPESRSVGDKTSGQE